MIREWKKETCVDDVKEVIVKHFKSNIDLAHIKVLMVKLYDFFEDQKISITPEDFNFEVNDFVDTFQNIADSVDATKVCQAAETYLPKLDL